MPFEKGHKKAKGRPEGSQNKLTKTVKEVLNNAFDKMQEDEDANLFSWGKENPTEFYKLCAKLIPNAVDVTTKGESINNIPITKWDDTSESSV